MPRYDDSCGMRNSNATITSATHPKTGPLPHLGSVYDEDGFCIHHPDIRLRRRQVDMNWRVYHKVCPRCSYLSDASRPKKKLEPEPSQATTSPFSHYSERRHFVSQKGHVRGYHPEPPSSSLASHKIDPPPSSSVIKNENFADTRRSSLPAYDLQRERAHKTRRSSTQSHRRRDEDWRKPRSFHPAQSPDTQDMVSKTIGKRDAASLNEENKAATIVSAQSTLASMSTAASSSTITFDTKSVASNRRGDGSHINLRSSKSSRCSSRSKDTRNQLRGVDPEESKEESIPRQVAVPCKNDTIVHISNIPPDIGTDAAASLFKHHPPDNIADRSTSSESEQGTIPSKTRRKPRGNSSKRLGLSARGSFVSSQPSTVSSISRSRDSPSMNSVRHDVDDEGYCIHHPEIQLLRLKDNGNWAVIRKKCPGCIIEDCPSMMGLISDLPSNVNTASASKSETVSTSITRSISNAFALSALQTPEEIEVEEATGRLKRRLAARAYHFPGNTWCEDWMQYMSNTHTVLGLFFHHPLHPLKVQERLVILFGSISIGLTISNMTCLYFVHKGFNAEEEVFTLNSHHSEYTGIPEVTITRLMITLWTLGSFLHTVFDLALWHMKACTLCRYGGQIDDRMARWGRVIGLFIVLIAVAAGSYAVLLRASMESRDADDDTLAVEDIVGDNNFKIDLGGKKSFRFLLGYLVEFVLALFVYYPLAVTVVFSGILGFGGRIPILGGRPREMQKEKRYEMNKKATSILKTLELDDDETLDAYSNSYDDDFDHFDESQIF